MRSWTRPALSACLALAFAVLPGAALAATLDLTPDAVVGKPDFTTPNSGSSGATTLYGPVQVAEDPVTGALWVADYLTNRVLRFSSAAGFSSGEAANLVLGQADFSASGCNRGGTPAANTLCSSSGVAVDQAGRLYVSDSGNNRILVYVAPFTSGMAATWVIGQANFTTNAANRGGTPGANTLATQQALALDRSGNLYVADWGNQRVLKFDAPAITGASASKVFGQPDFTSNTSNNGGRSASSLSYPMSVAVDRDDNLWIADTLNARVLRFDAGAAAGDTTADLVLCQSDFINGSSGTTASNCESPNGVSVDREGVVYVTDYSLSRVVLFTTLANGASATAVIGQANFTSGGCNRNLVFPTVDRLCGPYSTTLDRGGNLLVADYGNGRVLRYDIPRARSVPTIASLSPATVPAGGGAFTLTVNGSGFYGNSVVNWNGSPRATAYLSEHRLLAQVSASDVLSGGPFAITVTNPDPGGGTSTLLNLSLYAAAPLDGVADRVLGQPNFTSAVSTNPQVGEEVLGSPGASAVSSPTQLATDPASGRLFAVDIQSHRIISWPSAQAFNNAQPADLFLGQADEFSRSCNRGLAAPTAATLCGPYGMALDSAGALYVSDSSNNRVLKFVPPFTTGMAATRVFGQGGSFTTGVCNNGGVSANSLCSPYGIAVGGGTLFVLDTQNRRILGYNNPDGDFTADFAIGQPDLVTNAVAPASASRFVATSNSLALGADGRLYAALSQQNRVLRFSPPFATNMAADLVLGQPDFVSIAAGTTAASLSFPQGIAVDASGGVLVAEFNNHRVVRYAPPLANGMAATGVLGQTDFVTSSPGTTGSKLQGPFSVAADRAGRVYVGDYGNARILAFDRPFATRLAKADTTGNGKSDLVWRASDGGFAVWDMNGGALAGFFYGIVDNAWQVVATGDFNGDGHADLFWRRTDGATYLWFMKGTFPVGFVNTGVVPLEYTPVAVADFDGNGRADVMFRRSNGQNYMWLMSDGLITSQGFFGGTLPLEWVVQGADDLDGDGRADLVWRNTSTGEVYVWTMNGLTVAGAAPVLPTLTLDWQIQGLADFDGDGKADIQWRQNTGDNYLWTMNGLAVKAYVQQADVGPEWVIQGFGDFNADGLADIVYRHATTGEVVVWLMQVNAPTATPSLGNPGAIWTLAQP